MSGYDAPSKEERRLPVFVRRGGKGADHWIVSQVFADGRHDRFYYALVNPTDKFQGWSLIIYRYSLKDNAIQGKMYSWRYQDISVATGVKALLREEGAATEKYRMVEHLKGNYREAVHAYGMYFAGKKDVLMYGADIKSKPITDDVVFRQGGIRKVYSAAAQKSQTGVLAINSWEDFYTHIVNAPNQSAEAKEIIGVLIDTLRHGQSFFHTLTTSVDIDKDLLLGLRLVSADVKIRMDKLGYPAEICEQVGRLVMMGPDPYQQPAVTQAAPKKKKKDGRDPAE